MEIKLIIMNLSGAMKEVDFREFLSALEDHPDKVLEDVYAIYGKIENEV